MTAAGKRGGAEQGFQTPLSGVFSVSVSDLLSWGVPCATGLSFDFF